MGQCASSGSEASSDASQLADNTQDPEIPCVHDNTRIMIPGVGYYFADKGKPHDEPQPASSDSSHFEAIPLKQCQTQSEICEHYGDQGIRIIRRKTLDSLIHNFKLDSSVGEMLSNVIKYVNTYGDEHKTEKDYGPCRNYGLESDLFVKWDQYTKTLLACIDEALQKDPRYKCFKPQLMKGLDPEGGLDKILVYKVKGDKDGDHQRCTMHVDSDIHHLRAVFTIQNSEKGGELFALNTHQVNPEDSRDICAGKKSHYHIAGNPNETYYKKKGSYYPDFERTQSYMTNKIFSNYHRAGENHLATLFSSTHFSHDERRRAIADRLTTLAPQKKCAPGDLVLIPSATLMRRYQFLFPQARMYGASHMVTPVEHVGDKDRIRLVFDMFLYKREGYVRCSNDCGHDSQDYSGTKKYQTMGDTEYYEGSSEGKCNIVECTKCNGTGYQLCECALCKTGNYCKRAQAGSRHIAEVSESLYPTDI